MELPALLTFLFLIGAFVRSAWVFLSIPLVPAYSIGLYLGWWGNGVGDSWVFAMLFATILATAIVFAGVFTGGWIRDGFERTKDRRSRG